METLGCIFMYAIMPMIIGFMIGSVIGKILNNKK